MTVFWIISSLLTAGMFGAGVMKQIKSRAELKAMGMAWVDDFSDRQVKLIGVAQILGAIGVIVPLATKIMPILTPVSAACLAMLMAGAVSVHVRRKDSLKDLLPSLVFVGLATYVALRGFMWLA